MYESRVYTFNVKNTSLITMKYSCKIIKCIEDKMDMLIDYMKSAEKLDKKISSFVDRGLKERVKQVTIKLDDSPDK